MNRSHCPTLFLVGSFGISYKVFLLTIMEINNLKIIIFILELQWHPWCLGGRFSRAQYYYLHFGISFWYHHHSVVLTKEQTGPWYNDGWESIIRAITINIAVNKENYMFVGSRGLADKQVDLSYMTPRDWVSNPFGGII